MPCLTPAELRDAYFPGEAASAPKDNPQTIALVDAYNDYAAEADLNTYSTEFGLPTLKRCETEGEDDCFEQVNQVGRSEESQLPFPHNETQLLDRESECLTAGTQTEAELPCTETVEAEGWAIETSTDIETAHAICNDCKIMLVEAGEPLGSRDHYASLQEAEEAFSDNDLDSAEETAVASAQEVSNSWGGEEPASSSEAQARSFDHPGTVITASSGDSGYLNWTEAEEVEAEKTECDEEAQRLKGHEKAELLAYCAEIGYPVSAEFPASSPDVIAVGGTKLTLSKGAWQHESAWNEDPDPEGGNQGAGGGGCSNVFTAPAWQQEALDWSRVGCGSMRSVADVSADADPYTGVAVYDSTPYLRLEENAEGLQEIIDTPLYWWPIGGTSVASPIIASMYALAGGSDGVAYPAHTLYEHQHTQTLHQVTSGGNGRCDDTYASCAGSLIPTSALYPFDCGSEALVCKTAPSCGESYYAGPIGVGTPNGIAALTPGTQPSLPVDECTSKSGPSEPPQEEPTSGEPPNPTQNTPPAANGLTPGAGVAAKTPTQRPPGHISDLRLTAHSATAIAHLPRISTLSFRFNIDQSIAVEINLSRLLDARHSKTRKATWRAIGNRWHLQATAGLVRATLRSRARLTPGRYRLTVRPARGKAVSLAFSVPGLRTT